MNVIFLDIDGVLNCHEHDPEVLCGQIHRDKMQLFNVVLRATDARVVLSSAWRYIVHRGECNLAGMEWLLRSHGMLAGRLVGVTREDTMRANQNYSGNPSEWPTSPLPNERGDQISDWLADNERVAAHAVVDDLDLGISERGHPFVQVDGATGFNAEDAAKLMRIFGVPVSD